MLDFFPSHAQTGKPWAMATTVEPLVMATFNHPKCEDVAVKKWSFTRIEPIMALDLPNAA